MLAEEWEREGGGSGGWSRRWEVAFSRAYERADNAFKDKRLAPHSVGSTALVVVLSACQIIASNCGDSRAVLCRGAKTIPLTVDHKPERKEELARIVEGGGRILYWQGMRVEGVLSMTRAIGDRDLKPWVISVPEVTFMTRSEEDECLILASDGLWDVMSNEEVGELACRQLRRERRLAMTKERSSFPAQYVADFLLQAARKKLSSDNISAIVVDLKPLRRWHQH
uniref:PPM-type phosphatase domain-containing protein n=1 Tax=Davidia involucrata TaxID=16924 RepID=A0A5B7BA08_DAVIN